jgi:hypothetical protein
MGYHVLSIAPPVPDRAIDVLAYTDPLGTSSPRIKVQVERQSDTKIDAHGLCAFIGTLGANDVSIYVSAGGFTGEAKRNARSEQRQLTLTTLAASSNLCRALRAAQRFCPSTASAQAATPCKWAGWNPWHAGRYHREEPLRQRRYAQEIRQARARIARLNLDTLVVCSEEAYDRPTRASREAAQWL